MRVPTIAGLAPGSEYEPLRLARLGLEEQRAALSRAAEASPDDYRTDAEVATWQALDPEEASPDEHRGRQR